jgi:hypothetical protein
MQQEAELIHNNLRTLVIFSCSLKSLLFIHKNIACLVMDPQSICLFCGDLSVREREREREKDLENSDERGLLLFAFQIFPSI